MVNVLDADVTLHILTAAHASQSHLRVTLVCEDF